MNKRNSIISLAIKHLNIMDNMHISNSGKLHLKLNDYNVNYAYYSKTPKTMQLDTVSYNLLKKVWEAGEEGMRFSDIQRYKIGKSKYDKSPYKHRGILGSWLTNILPLYATQDPNTRKWIITAPFLIDHFESRFGR